MKTFRKYAIHKNRKSENHYLLRALHGCPSMGFAAKGVRRQACDNASALQSLRSFGLSGTTSFVTPVATDS
jgi:hypothetical protein